MNKKIKWEKLHGHRLFRRAFSLDKNETYLIDRGILIPWIGLRLINPGETQRHYDPIPGCQASTVAELKKLIQQYEDKNHFIKEW